MAFVPNTRSVRLYQNTGFDIINAPATPSLLDEFTYVDIPAINALQITRLNSVCIKATEDQVTNADYCYISDGTNTAYYAVTNYHMEKPDTCTLSIVMDYMLTAGGVTSSNWDVLDGITERHHIATADDELFAYTEEDPYLIPSKPLEIYFDDQFAFTTTGTSDSYTVIAATIDLYALATDTPTAVAYETSASETCIVPDIPELTVYSEASMPNYPGGSDLSSISPGVAYYDGTDATVQEGVARARSLGIETGAIISQVVIPSLLVTPELSDGMYTNLEGSYVSSIITDTDFQYQYGSVQNNRVYAGICNKYGMITIGSGNVVEFNPEDIYHSGDSYPVPYVIVDPRPSGRPYYRYQYYKNDDSNFFMNCIAGLNWQNVPLVYTDKSGSEIDTIRFNTEQSIKNQDAIVNGFPVNFNNGLNGLIGGVGNLIGGAIGAASFVGGHMYKNGHIQETPDTSRFSVPAETYAGLSPTYNTERMRANAAAQELQEFNINQNIVAPQLMFPRSEGLRDFLGNGCYIYRYYLSSSDMSKFDKILNMFGYRITEPLTKDMFSVRSKFNYVKAKGVSIGGSLPRWLREGMSEELKIGKRFWSVAPDNSYYATNGGNT